MFEASNFSVCNGSEQTYCNKSHLILVFAMAQNRLTTIKVIRFLRFCGLNFNLLRSRVFVQFDFVDRDSTQCYQSHRRSGIWIPRIVDSVIRVIDGPEFGYLVLYIVLSESSTARNLLTLYYTCYYLDYPDVLICTAVCVGELSQRLALIRTGKYSAKM